MLNEKCVSFFNENETHLKRGFSLIRQFEQSRSKIGLDERSSRIAALAPNGHCELAIVRARDGLWQARHVGRRWPVSGREPELRANSIGSSPAKEWMRKPFGDAAEGVTDSERSFGLWPGPGHVMERPAMTPSSACAHDLSGALIASPLPAANRIAAGRVD